MLKPWTKLGSRTLYQGERVLIREDLLELPDGQQRSYPAMRLGSSAGVVALTAQGEVVLVRQYRHIPGEFCWEVPGGGMQPGESPEAGAQRELREEAGYRAGRLTRLGGLWPNNAYLDETIHIFVAEDLVEDPLPADQDEALERRAFPFAEALAMVQDDRITCGVTKLALLWAARLKGL